MSEKMRIDKLFSSLGLLSRSQIKKEVKKGIIVVNGVKINDSNIIVNVDEDEILYNGIRVVYEKFVYYILNKPKDVVTARKDNINKTVMDLIDDSRKELSPVGRLDKDTTGILLITDDGNFLHNLMSPKKHVSKTYYAKIEGKVTEEDIIKFKEGINIGDDKNTLPADLVILKSDLISEIELTIYEGRYHQVKRMFESVNKKVIELERIKIGNLSIKNELKYGEYKKVTKEYLESNIYESTK